MQQFLLTGRIALVSGAGSGLGAVIAKSLAQANARVLVADVNMEGAEGVARALRDDGLDGVAKLMDVTDEASVDEVFDELANSGGLDVLFNNVASYLNVGGSILDQSPDFWRKGMKINLESVFLCSRRAAHLMAEQGRGGSIVNISSVDSMTPAMGVGYDVANAAVNHFGRSLALDLSPHKVRVNTVAPGVVSAGKFLKVASGELPPVFPPDGSKSGLMNAVTDCRMANVPFGMGDPEDIGNAVLFFASSAAKFVTGQILFVDGGWTLV